MFNYCNYTNHLTMYGKFCPRHNGDTPLLLKELN